jgi:hypothetical protein
MMGLLAMYLTEHIAGSTISTANSESVATAASFFMDEPSLGAKDEGLQAARREMVINVLISEQDGA